MRMLALAAMAAAAAGAAALADERYDRRIDQAAAEIAAARMGSIRGGFGVDEEPVMLKTGETAPPPRAAPVQLPKPPSVWEDGLARAVERKPAASPDL